MNANQKANTHVLRSGVYQDVRVRIDETTIQIGQGDHFVLLDYGHAKQLRDLLNDSGKVA